MARKHGRDALEWAFKMKSSQPEDRILSPKGQFTKLKSDGYFMKSVLSGRVYDFDPVIWSGVLPPLSVLQL